MYYESQHITIIYDTQNNWLEVFWKGYLIEDVLKSSSEKILEAIEQYKVMKLLVSHQAVKGTWTNSNEWVKKEWTPKAIEAGIKHIAIVYSEDVFAKYALNDMVKNASKSLVSIFGTIEEAQDWLIILDV